VHLYNYIKFSANRYIALAAIVIFRVVQKWVVQKWLGTNKIVRTESHTGSKFSLISLGLLYTWGTIELCTHIAVFSLRRQMAPQQAPNSEPHVFVNFVAFWWRITSAIMDRFGPLSVFC